MNKEIIEKEDEWNHIKEEKDKRIPPSNLGYTQRIKDYVNELRYL